MRVHRVLCPVDFSDPSRRALHHAAAIAACYDAELHVLHVVAAAMPPALPLMLIAAVPRPSVDDVRTRAAQALEAFVARAGLPVATRLIVREAPAVEAIVACASEIAADLIVLGSHGREGVTHLLFGSTAERVLHKAPCPAMVVPFHADEPGSMNHLRFTHVLCALDFSAASLKALALARSLAQENGAALTVLHVVEALADDELEGFPPVGVREHVEALTRAARERLHAAVPAEARAVGAVREVVRYGRAAHAILREADERSADLIVIGAEGHSILGLLVLGSSTHTVVRRATCPVLTTRA